MEQGRANVEPYSNFGCLPWKIKLQHAYNLLLLLPSIRNTCEEWKYLEVTVTCSLMWATQFMSGHFLISGYFTSNSTHLGTTNKSMVLSRLNIIAHSRLQASAGIFMQPTMWIKIKVPWLNNNRGGKKQGNNYKMTTSPVTGVGIMHSQLTAFPLNATLSSDNGIFSLAYCCNASSGQLDKGCPIGCHRMIPGLV